MITDYRISLIILLIGMITAAIALVGMGITLIYYYRNEAKIKKAVYDLRFDLTDEKVRNFGNLLDHIYIPDRSSNWKTIRAGYEIINMDSNIDEGLKKDLKIILLSKGVLVV